MMRPITTEQAEFWLQNILLGTLKNESRTTRSVLEAVPADKRDHRPASAHPLGIKRSFDVLRHHVPLRIRAYQKRC